MTQDASIIAMPFPPYVAELFLGAESRAADERGPAQMARSGTRVKRPTNTDIAALVRARAGRRATMGQCAEGVADAKHNSGAAANLLWSDVAGVDDDNGTRGVFHMFSHAEKHALRPKLCAIRRRLSPHFL